jgi:hypothetical protein
MLSTHFALALAANAGPDPISFDFGPRGGRDFSMGDDLFAIIHQITTAVGTNGFSDRHLHRGTTVIFFRRHRAIAEFPLSGFASGTLGILLALVLRERRCRTCILTLQLLDLLSQVSILRTQPSIFGY